jgi:hypothetical protein
MADDIKVKLGIEIGGLFENLDKAVNKLNEVAKTADKAETEIGQIGNETVKVDTTEAISNLNQLSNKTEETSKGFSGFAAGFGGGLAATGLSMLSDGIVSIAGKIKDGALAADEFGDTLEVAFKQQGINDVEGQIGKVRKSTLNLANDLGLPTQRTRELATTVATMGGVVGAQAESLTKLSAGLEVFSGGAVKGEAVALAFSKGLADPEGAAAIEKLAKKYPQLAETLRSNIDPAEKMKQANLLLGDSFKTVAEQQGDAGGSMNKLQNQLGEAFETIGSGVYDALGPIISDLLPVLQDGIPKAMAFMIQAFSTIQTSLSTVFGAVEPVLTFMYDNFDAISKVVGVVAIAFTAYSIVTSTITAVTAAYAAVQTALGGSISIATIAQYAWNLAMSLNPIGAVVAALAVLGAGIYAITEALSVSAEETRQQSEENVKLIETQKDANAEQTKAVQSTKTLADEFLSLSKKKKLTAEETKKLQGLTKDLSAEYPDLVKNTSNYKENLDGVESIANRAGDSLKGLAEESARLDKALQGANQTLSFAKRNEAIEEAIATTKTLGVVTDSYGNNAINAFANALYGAKTQEQATEAYTKATRELASNSKALAAVQTAYNSQIAALNAYKKTAETVIEVDKTLAKKPEKPKDKAKEQATALEQLKEFYKDKQDAQKNDIERELADEKNKYADKKALRTKLELEANKELRQFLNERIGGISDAETFLKESQLTVKITPSKAKGETVEDINTFYTQEIVKLRKGLDSEVKIKINIPEFKEELKEVDTAIKEYTTTATNLIPVQFTSDPAELAKVQEEVVNFQDFLKIENERIAQLQKDAQIAGNEEAAQKFAEAISSNIQSINRLESKVKDFALKSQEEQKKNTLEYQVQNALQTSFLDVFNADKIRKEKETNEAIKKERLDSLNAEENDLNKSLAKREISAEEYAAKLAEINNGRQKAQEETEVTVLERLKQAGDKVVGDVLKTQGAAFTEQAKKMEGGSKIMYEAMGGLATSFGALAASGKATLKDFAGASIDIAVQAMMKMIPIWTAEIFATSVAELGVGGLAVAAGLQIVLMGLVSAARSAGGFKDGVVGLHGEGTETSDSIPAWLSKGESVITARATRNNREELEFMNRTGLSIAEFYKMRMPSTSVSVTPDGDLIREVRKLREETRGLGVRIQRNTSVEVSGVLTADSKSINALIVEQKRRSARRG